MTTLMGCTSVRVLDVKGHHFAPNIEGLPFTIYYYCCSVVGFLAGQARVLKSTTATAQDLVDYYASLVKKQSCIPA
jgi:alpha-glucuronidase